MNTLNETVRRLKVARDLIRETEGYPIHWRVEVGTRIYPIHVPDRAPSRGDVMFLSHVDDDLVDFYVISELRASDARGDGAQIFEPGYVAHLYFTSRGPNAELEDVATVWLGDESHEPEVIS